MREINLTYQPEKNLIFSKSEVEKVYKPRKMVVDYFTFGMMEPGRNTNPTDYNYSFQGMQKDNDVAGSGNSYTTYFRQYDPRLGRWKTPDPVIHAWESPYVGFGNNPINNIDPQGNSFLCVAYAVGQAIAAAAPYIAAVGATVGAEAASVAPHFSNNTNYLEGNDPRGSDKTPVQDVKVHTQVGKDGVFEVIADALPETKSLKDIINGIPDAMEGFFSNLLSLVTGDVSGVITTSKEGNFPETSGGFYDFASIVYSNIEFIGILTDGISSLKGKNSSRVYNENNRGDLPFNEIKVFNPNKEAVINFIRLLNKRDTAIYVSDGTISLIDHNIANKGDTVLTIMEAEKLLKQLIKKVK